MANTKSAQKKNRADIKKRASNVIVRSKTRSLVIKARKAVDKTPDTAGKDVLKASSALDNAASKGVIHPNTAARKKSRLAKKLNKIEAK